jgi:hypothetical protein
MSSCSAHAASTPITSCCDLITRCCTPSLEKHPPLQHLLSERLLHLNSPPLAPPLAPTHRGSPFGICCAHMYTPKPLQPPTQPTCNSARLPLPHPPPSPVCRASSAPFQLFTIQGPPHQPLTAPHAPVNARSPQPPHPQPPPSAPAIS